MRDWQATLFDHGWMIPGYPPELGGRNCTPVQTLIYLEKLASRRIPRSGHFPGYAIVAPSLLEFGNDEQQALAPAAIRGDTIWCIGMSEPNAGSDLAGLCRRAPSSTTTTSSSTARRCGRRTRRSRRSASATCAPIPTLPKHKGISLLIVDMDTPGIDIRPLRHLNGTAGLRRGVLHRRRSCRARTSSASSTAAGGITQGSLAHERAGLWVEGVGRLEQTRRRARRARAQRSAVDRRPGRAPQDRASVHELASSLRALGYKGFASFAQGSSAPEHSYMKMATSEAGKARTSSAWRSRARTAPVTDAERGADAGRWVARLLHVVREHDRRRQLARSSATSSPSACSGSRGA